VVKEKAQGPPHCPGRRPRHSHRFCHRIKLEAVQCAGDGGFVLCHRLTPIQPPDAVEGVAQDGQFKPPPRPHTDAFLGGSRLLRS
jgi:hypothetical protein